MKNIFVYALLALLLPNLSVFSSLPEGYEEIYVKREATLLAHMTKLSEFFGPPNIIPLNEEGHAANRKVVREVINRLDGNTHVDSDAAKEGFIFYSFLRSLNGKTQIRGYIPYLNFHWEEAKSKVNHVDDILGSNFSTFMYRYRFPINEETNEAFQKFYQFVQTLRSDIKQRSTYLMLAYDLRDYYQGLPQIQTVENLPYLLNGIPDVEKAKVYYEEKAKEYDPYAFLSVWNDLKFLYGE